MIFKYSEYQSSNGKKIFRPSIPITFQVGKKEFPVEALIDSGADMTILPIEIAGYFDFKLGKESRLPISGAGGGQFFIYRSPIKLEHIIQQIGHRNMKWSSFVYFAEQQPTILLGQKGFFDNVKVALDGSKKVIEIT